MVSLESSKFREKGFLPLLISSLIIMIVIGVQYYMSIKEDEQEARKLVNRELKIVEQSIVAKFIEAEFSMDDLHDAVADELKFPDRMLEITNKIVKDNDFLKAAAVGFVPNYYPQKGYWYEPRSIVKDGVIVNEISSDGSHDYFRMKWYENALATTSRTPLTSHLSPVTSDLWTDPYIDHSQNNSYVMSLSLPVYHNKAVAAVLCIDVELKRLRQLLKDSEPYPGSICELISSDGDLLVSSDDYDEKVAYFTDSKAICKGGMTVRLSCPKNEIYGDTQLMNIITFCLLLIGMALLSFIVHHAHTTITKLHAARQQRQMIEREMHIAHDIQMKILRGDFPSELCATLVPMREVGGDLYDFYQDDQTLYFIIGDVSGKGIPAAMMMGATTTLFRMAARHCSTPAMIISEINQVLSERNPGLMFITAFVGKIDMQHGLLTYCNAGHNPPVINGVLLDTDPDIPIGYDHDYSYRQYGALFPEGSRLVLYTDGITESRNKERKMMGVHRLMEIVAKYQKETPQVMTERILADAQQYAKGTEQVDDITLMCIANNTPQIIPSLVITNEIEELQRVKQLLREYCDCLLPTLNSPRKDTLSKRESSTRSSFTRKVLLAVEEAVVNIINYAYPKGHMGRIDIDIQGTPATGGTGDITIRLADYGEYFDPNKRKAIDVTQKVDEREVGGLGIYLYQQLMDTVIYERTDDGRNVLTMTKNIDS